MDLCDDALLDLNLIGCTVDEASEKLDKYLDKAIVYEQLLIRIIHGRGTGQLRRSIGKLLKNHPQVQTFTSAPAEQGGDGVTIVKLKD